MLELALGVSATSDTRKIQEGDEVIIVFPRSQHRKAIGIAKALSIYKRVYARILDMDLVGQTTVRDLIDAYGYSGTRVIIFNSLEFAKPLTKRQVASAMVRGMETGMWDASRLGVGESRVLYALLVAASRPRVSPSQNKKIQRKKFGSMKLALRKSEIVRIVPHDIDLTRVYLNNLESNGYITITNDFLGYVILLNLDRINQDLFKSFYTQSKSKNFVKNSPWLRLPFYDSDHNHSTFLVGTFKDISPSKRLGKTKEDSSNITPEKSNTLPSRKIPMGINNFGFAKSEWSPKHATAFAAVNAGHSIRSAAAVVGVSPSTLARWIRNWTRVVKLGRSMRGLEIWLSFLERKLYDLMRMPELIKRMVYAFSFKYYPYGMLSKGRWRSFLFGYSARPMRPIMASEEW